MRNPNCTTLSEVFCCGVCHDSVALIVLPGGDLAYECISPKCGKTVHSDCPEALTLIDDVTIELATPRQLGRRIAVARELVTA